MRTAHRFADEDVIDRGARAVRAGRVLLSVAARRATRANVAAAWLDAGLAVLDAANAYFEYAEEKHRTRELRACTRDLEQQLDHALKQMNMARDDRLDQYTDRLNALEQRAGEMDARAQHRLERFALDDELLGALRQMLCQCRKNPDSDFEQLLKLQSRLDAFIRETLTLRLDAISQA